MFIENSLSNSFTNPQPNPSENNPTSNSQHTGSVIHTETVSEQQPESLLSLPTPTHQKNYSSSTPQTPISVPLIQKNPNAGQGLISTPEQLLPQPSSSFLRPFDSQPYSRGSFIGGMNISDSFNRSGPSLLPNPQSSSFLYSSPPARNTSLPSKGGGSFCDGQSGSFYTFPTSQQSLLPSPDQPLIQNSPASWQQTQTQLGPTDLNSPEGQNLLFNNTCPYDRGILQCGVIPLPGGRSTTVRKTCPVCLDMYYYNPHTSRFVYFL